MKHGRVKVKYNDGTFGVVRYFLGFKFGYYSSDGSWFFSNSPYWKFSAKMSEEMADRILDEGEEQLKQDK